MNNKISSIQIGMLVALTCSSLYLGLSDLILINMSRNNVIISMVTGSIIGFLIILMYFKINNYEPNLNIYQKTKKLFGKYVGTIINIILILIACFFLFIALRSMITFITSKYLRSTSYFMIGSLIIITIFIISYNGIEQIARLFQILFVLIIILIIYIEVSLVKYVEIDNIIPIINNDYLSLLRGTIFFAGISAGPIVLFLSVPKNNIINNKKYNKLITFFYFLATTSMIIVMIFITGCLGYNIASTIRYPEFYLLKKIILHNSDLHVENILAFRWLIYAIALSSTSLFSIKEGIKEFNIKQKKERITTLIICIMCLILSKIIFPNVPDSITNFNNVYLLFLVSPIIIIMILIIIMIIIKKLNKNKLVQDINNKQY